MATTKAPLIGSVEAQALRVVALALVCYAAWDIRCNAVRTYGRVIHEFDPWFNYRASEYLWENGWAKFSTWFDTMVWYPLGRPVGTTIYPGLQVTTVVLLKAAHMLGWSELTLNDTAVFVPALFGALASMAVYGLASEVTSSPNAGVAAAAIFSVLPAHLMRSVAGGFDNESIAVTAIVLTFFLWTRALRTPSSWVLWSPLAALAYVYMVAAWGGYTFVLNMVGLHVTALVFLGRFTPSLHHAYTVFMLIGTYGAIQFPVVGLKPLRDMEHMGPLVMCLVLQVLMACEWAKAKYNITDPQDFKVFRYKVFLGAFVLALVALCFFPSGYFGPISNRVRSLFIKHTHTGNPLVDSVAEHQATKPEAYWLYFHLVFYGTPIGFVLCCVQIYRNKGMQDAKWFLLLYTLATAYFSRKMVRLILILAPAAAICSGLVVAACVEWAHAQLMNGVGGAEAKAAQAKAEAAKAEVKTPASEKKANKKKESKKTDEGHLSAQVAALTKFVKSQYAYHTLLRKAVAVVLLLVMAWGAVKYYRHCDDMSANLSEPQIMIRGRARDGSFVIIDDFRESYWWLRDNTPEDSRVMAWWDYGYQITGVGNRTSIADGNTWNHEHLALLGKCLVSEEEKSYKITRHLADYVLVWSTRYAGMYGDDLAKVTHIARIAGSVYSDIFGNGYYMESHNQPSPLLRNSLLYRLHGYQMNPDIQPLKHFEHVFTSKNAMVRIYKVLDVAKRTEFGDYPAWIKKHVISKSKAYNQKQGRGGLPV